MLFKKNLNPTYRELYASGHVCFAHHFTPVPRAQCLAQAMHNKNVCKEKKKAEFLLDILLFTLVKVILNI